ncbi:SMI1/KNR4 family protein [Fusobacterium necrophorum]|uniref:SMI1/KNR4 family protein n=1 Tax=Fusobacterium necrophorum TaxID=859 RepID=UPI001C9B5B12|nr:SMI1/KNR4 family protein [Fusobacterium necrophorum]
MEISSLDRTQFDTLPSYWQEAFNAHSSEEKLDIILSEWENYDYQFQAVHSYLEDNLIDVDLIRQNNEISLLYSLRNAAGNICYYEGKNPKTKHIPENIRSRWNEIPESFRDIYDELHNGWVFFASQSNGLSKVEDLFFLDEMDWGILEEIDVHSLPFSLSDSIPFFSNGMGAYACFDLKSKDKQSGFIWYHDKAPRLDIELWAVIDEWTKIGIER